MADTQAMEFPLRQHHIADATGLTLVHVGKTLSEFRRNGLIEIIDRTLVINDPARLSRIARA
jgi:CRP-like cAMP-binding protein